MLNVLCKNIHLQDAVKKQKYVGLNFTPHRLLWMLIRVERKSHTSSVHSCVNSQNAIAVFLQPVASPFRLVLCTHLDVKRYLHRTTRFYPLRCGYHLKKKEEWMKHTEIQNCHHSSLAETEIILPGHNMSSLTHCRPGVSTWTLLSL